MKSAENTRIGELDALRGMAALAIVASHICLGRFDNVWLDVAPTSLYLFFMISGVVISQSMDQSSSRMEFLRRRFRRIMPTYVLAVVLTSLLLVVHHLVVGWQVTDVVWRALGNLTLFEHFFRIRYVDGSYWTLTVEVVFYVFMALFWRHAWTMGVAVMAFLGAAVWLFPEGYAHFVVTFYVPLAIYFPLFYAGHLCRKIYLGERKPITYVLLAISFVWQWLLLPETSLSKFVELGNHTRMLVLWYVLFVLVSHRMLAFLGRGISRYAGELSYPLYLVHHFVVFFVCMPWLQDELQWSFSSAALVSLAVALLLAEGLRRLALRWQHLF